MLLYNSVEVWNPQYRYRCSLSNGGARWHLPVIDAPVTTSMWLPSRRMFAVGFTNGKVVLAGMSVATGRGVVNHSDVKDAARITLLHTLDTGNSSPVASIRFSADCETMLLCAKGVDVTEFSIGSGSFIRAFVPELQLHHCECVCVTLPQ